MITSDDNYIYIEFGGVDMDGDVYEPAEGAEAYYDFESDYIIRKTEYTLDDVKEGKNYLPVILGHEINWCSPFDITRSQDCRIGIMQNGKFKKIWKDDLTSGESDK